MSIPATLHGSIQQAVLYWQAAIIEGHVFLPVGQALRFDCRCRGAGCAAGRAESVQRGAGRGRGVVCWAAGAGPQHVVCYVNQPARQHQGVDLHVRRRASQRGGNSAARRYQLPSGAPVASMRGQLAGLAGKQGQQAQ